MLTGLKEVFSNKRYLALTAVSFVLVLFVILWIPNFSLLTAFLGSQNASFFEKVSFAFLNFLTLKTNLSYFSAFTIVLTSLLFSVNLSMLTYYFKRKSAALAASGSASIVGVLSGFLGIGCASCGSVALSLLGLSSAAAILPFGGQEFNIMAIGLLVFSLHTTSKHISQKTCPM